MSGKRHITQMTDMKPLQRNVEDQTYCKNDRHDTITLFLLQWSAGCHKCYSSDRHDCTTKNARDQTCCSHYNDVIIGAKAYQMTNITIVYSMVYSGADQRKHQISASLAFVRGIHGRPVNSPHKWPVTRKMFPFDDVIMKWQILHYCKGRPRSNRYSTYRHDNITNECLESNMLLKWHAWHYYKGMPGFKYVTQMADVTPLQRDVEDQTCPQLTNMTSFQTNAGDHKCYTRDRHDTTAKACWGSELFLKWREYPPFTVQTSSFKTRSEWRCTTIYWFKF